MLMVICLLERIESMEAVAVSTVVYVIISVGKGVRIWKMKTSKQFG